MWENDERLARAGGMLNVGVAGANMPRSASEQDPIEISVQACHDRINYLVSNLSMSPQLH